MTELLLYSWNVNGIRAAEKKGFIDWVHTTNADIISVQETKSHPEQLSQQLLNIDGYKSYWKSGERKGYSGVGIYSRVKPIHIIDSFDDPILNAEGRLLGLEFKNFFFFTGYFPNGGQGPHRIQYKLDFYNKFEALIKNLPKPTVFCGDVNTAHNEIDLSRPKENQNRSGFMKIERAWLNHIIDEEHYIDTFRHFHKEPEKYSWWDMKTRARDRNVGWRIDYFITSPKLKDMLIDADIDSNTLGSDHAPIWLRIKN